MGFLSNLFGGGRDWSAELERVERDLAGDEPVLAYEGAQRIVRKAPAGPIEQHARGLVVRASAAIVERALERSAASEAEGELADAADWLTSALEHEIDPERRILIERRHAALLEATHRGSSPFGLGAATGRAAAVEDDGEDADDEDEHDPLWDAVLATLDERLAEQWEGREPAFREAVVALNHGDGEAALELLGELVDEEPRDPVLRLERGRALLLVGDAAAAASDLDVAWKHFGDQPLDAVGALSVPALWGEASLAADAAETVVARLEHLADGGAPGGPEPALVYAMALARRDRLDDAVAVLGRLARLAPRDARLPLEQAELLARGGRNEEALAVLEAAVAPTCVSGCASPRHLASLRALAHLHLGHGDPERARQLIAFVAHDNGGRLAAVDHRLLERYYQATGDAEAAAEAAEQAAALDGIDVDRAAPVAAPGGRKRVL